MLDRLNLSPPHTLCDPVVALNCHSLALDLISLKPSLCGAHWQYAAEILAC